MSDIISRSALGIGKAKREVFDNPAYADGWNAAIDIITEAPAVDAVPVVWCKECKHHGNFNSCYYHSADDGSTPIFMRDKDFCSYGERRNDESKRIHREIPERD